MPYQIVAEWRLLFQRNAFTFIAENLFMSAEARQDNCGVQFYIPPVSALTNGNNENNG